MRFRALMVAGLVLGAVQPAHANTQGVSPVLEYVLEAGSGQYDAWFGYLNNNPAAVTIPVGSKNKFTPTENRGQPTVFQPGRVVRAFSVRFDGNDLVWTLTGPDGNTRTSTASKQAAVKPGSADLNLTAAGSTAPSGETTVLFKMKNEGPYKAEDSKLEISIPGGWNLVSATGSGGAVPRTPTKLQWEVAALEYGDTATVTVVVTGDRTRGNVEVHASCQHKGPDPDPSDNHASYTIQGQSGGAGDGGLESNGRLALLLARRLALREMGVRVKGKARLAEGRPTTELDALLPESGPAGTRAVVNSPEDLIGVTNAVAVSGADYLDAEGVRLGAILAVATDQGIYEHSKAVCDRLTGAQVEQIRAFSIGIVPFLMAKLRQPGGAVEYAVSFAVSPEGSPWEADTRWNPSAGARFERGRILNFQVWASNADIAEELTAALLARMPRVVSEDAVVSPPQVFVKSVKYVAGKVQLELVRLNGSAETIEVQGSKATTETGKREWVKHSVELADAVALETGPLFDFNFRLGEDTVYAADGAWSFWDSAEEGRVTEFAVEADSALDGWSGSPVERSMRATGLVKTYVSLFRHLRPKALPADLSAFRAIEFTASGVGTLEFIPVKASIRTPSAQARKRFELSGGAERYRIEFADLAEKFDAGDITTLYFNILGDGAESRAFDVKIEGIRLIQK